MKQELADTLTKLIAFHPVTSSQESVKQLLDLCAKDLAIEDTQIIENNGVHTLITRTQPTLKPRLMLAAHVDVVPSSKEMQKARVIGSKMIGRGAKDMLFAVAGYIWLVNELRDQLPDLDIAIVLNGDEEVGGGNSIPHLLDLGWRPEAVWLPDAGDTIGELMTRAKGVHNFSITVHGKAHHGSKPWEGGNAAHKLLKLLGEIDNVFGKSSPECSTCVVTCLKAGEAENQGPATATARLDIRYTDDESLSRIKDWLEDACQRFDAEISGLLHAPAHIVDVQSAHVKKYIKICEKATGKSVQFITASGASDGRYFGELNIPVIMASPLGGGLHSEDEWIDLDALAEYCHVMKKYVLKTARIR